MIDSDRGDEASADARPFTEDGLQRALVDRAWRAMEREDLADAVALVSESVRVDPACKEAWNAHGQILRRAGRPSEAVQSFNAALALDPDYAHAWSALGTALLACRSFSRSLACHRTALQISPQDADLNHNYGAALMMAGDEAQAIVAFERALALRPQSPRSRWERGACRLRMGDYAGGWEDYELRLAPGLRQSDPPTHLPRWTGESLEGRRLLVCAEQGLGDMIWGARYLKALKGVGAFVIVQCGVELVELLRGVEGVDEIVRLSEPPPYADLYIEMCSVPRLLGADEATASGASYVPSSPSRRGRFSPWLGTAPGAFRVGLVWSGNSRFPANAERSTSVEGMVLALAQPGVRLYSLQKGPAAADLQRLAEGGSAAPRIVELGPLVNDLADTAEICSRLDLVVTTDTSVAHLAGALGTPVWLLLNFRAYWLWGLGRETTRWYDSMTLFRARRWDDWDDVFDRVAVKLARRLHATPPHA